MTEESLLHGILCTAVDDCRIGAREDAIDAYRWITDKGPWITYICEHLGLDVEAGASTVVSLYGERCEKFMREEAQWRRQQKEAAERRQEIEQAKLDAARARAAVTAERERLRCQKKTARQNRDKNAARARRRAAAHAATALARETGSGASTDSSGR